MNKYIGFDIDSKKIAAFICGFKGPPTSWCIIRAFLAVNSHSIFMLVLL